MLTFVKGSVKEFRAQPQAAAAPEKGLSSEEFERLDWTEKHNPSSLKEVSVHHSYVKNLRDWLTRASAAHREFGHKPSFCPFVLALCGPSGCGKSTLVTELCKEMDVELVEWVDDMLENDTNARQQAYEASTLFAGGRSWDNDYFRSDEYGGSIYEHSCRKEDQMESFARSSAYPTLQLTTFTSGDADKARKSSQNKNKNKRGSENTKAEKSKKRALNGAGQKKIKKKSKGSSSRVAFDSDDDFLGSSSGEEKEDNEDNEENEENEEKEEQIREAEKSRNRVVLMHDLPQVGSDEQGHQQQGAFIASFRHPVILIVSDVGGKDDMSYAVRDLVPPSVRGRVAFESIYQGAATDALISKALNRVLKVCYIISYPAASRSINSLDLRYNKKYANPSLLLSLSFQPFPSTYLSTYLPRSIFIYQQREGVRVSEEVEETASSKLGSKKRGVTKGTKSGHPQRSVSPALVHAIAESSSGDLRHAVVQLQLLLQSSFADNQNQEQHGTIGPSSGSGASASSTYTVTGTGANGRVGKSSSLLLGPDARGDAPNPPSYQTQQNQLGKEGKYDTKAIKATKAAREAVETNGAFVFKGIQLPDSLRTGPVSDVIDLTSDTEEEEEGEKEEMVVVMGGEGDHCPVAGALGRDQETERLQLLRGTCEDEEEGAGGRMERRDALFSSLHAVAKVTHAQLDANGRFKWNFPPERALQQTDMGVEMLALFQQENLINSIAASAALESYGKDSDALYLSSSLSAADAAVPVMEQLSRALDLCSDVELLVHRKYDPSALLERSNNAVFPDEYVASLSCR